MEEEGGLCWQLAKTVPSQIPVSFSLCLHFQTLPKSFSVLVSPLLHFILSCPPGVLSPISLVETLSPCALVCLAGFLENTEAKLGKLPESGCRCRLHAGALSHPVVREGRSLPVKPSPTFNHLGTR